MLSVIALRYRNPNLVEYCLCPLLKEDVLVFVDSDVVSLGKTRRTVMFVEKQPSARWKDFSLSIRLHNSASRS